MRKYLAALLIVLILFSIAGCASEEIGMYSLMRDISQLNAFETSGNITVSMQGQLLDEMISDPTIPDEIESIITSGFEIKYNIIESKKPMERQISIEFRKNGESDYKKVTTLIWNEKVIYVKFGELINFIKPYVSSDNPDDIRVMDEIIAKVDYLQVDLESGMYTAIYTKDNTSIEQDEKLNKLITGFIDVFKDAFKGFSTGTITRKNNGYEFMLEAKDIQPLITSFIDYVYNNIDDIFTVVSDKINTLTDEEMKTIQDVNPSSEITKPDMIAGLEEMRDSVKAITPQELEDAKNDTFPKDWYKSIDGSYLRYYLSKSGEDSFDITSALKVKYEDQLTIELSEIAKTTKLSSFSINKPDNCTTMDGFKDIVSSIIPPKATDVRIHSITGETVISYTNGKETKTTILPVMKDESNYVPLSVIGEAFGESTGWDSVTKAPYINRDGNITEMEGFIKNGVAYVKIRDFEKLDYMVFWNEYTKEIEIMTFANKSIFEYLSSYSKSGDNI